MTIYYYKAILPTGEEVKFSSLNFCKYNPYMDEMLLVKEQDAQYVSIDNNIYRIPWLKYEPKKTLGKYPTITTNFITKEEYDEYIKTEGTKSEE